jgi:hypothetical protein
MLRCSLPTTFAAVLVATIVSAGCATPTSRGYAFARAHGFERAIVSGADFRHVVWRKAGMPSDDVLHVYLEGDGSPHPAPDRIALDPTPGQPLMLHLMALDPHPSIYVGRPCYWGLNGDRGCSPYFWTLGRFAPSVVNSLVAVINMETAAAPRRRIILYGHSGGAALALLATREGLVVAGVVTVGGNLDPDAWAALHGYSPLTGSLNPAGIAPPEPQPPIRHYVGENDLATPVALVRAAASRVGGEVVVVPGFDHHCCWESIWQQAVEFPLLR